MEATMVRESIKQQLIRFDQYSKHLKALQENGSDFKGKRVHIEKELLELKKKESDLLKKLQDEQYSQECLMAESRPNMKKIEKTCQRIDALKADLQMIKNRISQLETELQEVIDAEEQTASIEQVKMHYKAIMANLSNFRQKYPEMYDSLEQETGIFFFSLPKLNGQ